MTLLLIFLFGLLIGSFLNALVWRLYMASKGSNDPGLSITKGRSVCPNCRHSLSARDLVPVLSWVSLSGRCRYCKKPISAQYPAVELITAILLVTAYSILQPNDLTGWLNYSFIAYIICVSIALAVYDLRWQILPNRLILPSIGLTGLWLLSRPATIPSHLLAALIAGGVFYLLASLAGGRMMGGGDVKLAFLIGLALGPIKTLVALVLAFNSAAVVGLTLIMMGRKSRKDAIPFGPFLVMGFLTGILFGDELIRSYESLLLLP